MNHLIKKFVIQESQEPSPRSNGSGFPNSVFIVALQNITKTNNGYSLQINKSQIHNLDISYKYTQIQIHNCLYTYTQIQNKENEKQTTVAESRVKVNSNFSYYSCNFSASVKCYQKKFCQKALEMINYYKVLFPRKDTNWFLFAQTYETIR